MVRNRPAAWPQLHVVVETRWAAKVFSSLMTDVRYFDRRNLRLDSPG
jgi:hypothetical protein